MSGGFDSKCSTKVSMSTTIGGKIFESFFAHRLGSYRKRIRVPGKRNDLRRRHAKRRRCHLCA